MNKLNRSSSLHFSILIFLISSSFNYSSAQTDTNQQEKWSVGIYGGEITPLSEFMTQYKMSAHASIGIGYSINSHIEIYLSTTYFFLKRTSDNDGYLNNMHLSKITPHYIAAIAGCKYNFSKTIPRFFSEAGVGIFNYKEQYVNSFFWEYRVINTNNFGFNLAIGLEINTYKEIIASFKILYNYINTSIENQSATSSGFSIGIKYMF